MIGGSCVVIVEVVFWWVDRCIGGIAAAAAAIDAGMTDFTRRVFTYVCLAHVSTAVITM